MTKLVNKLANLKVMFTFFGAFLVLVVLANTLFKQNFTFLTQTINYSADQAYNLLDTIGKNGRTSHLLIFIADFVMVMLYSCFLIGANYYTFSSWVKNCAAISIITFFPVILALIQLGEILFLTIIITNYQTRLEPAVHLTNSLTIIKYYLTPICFLLPIAGLCGKIKVLILQKRMNKSEP